MSAKLLAAVSSYFDHGLLIIDDPRSQKTHSNWNPNVEAVHLDDDSLYIGVRQTVSGIVSISIFEGNGPSCGELLFSGVVNFPSQKMRIYDPNEKACLFIPIDFKKVKMRIYGDDFDESKEVEIFLDGHDPL
ncbi:hypothetical protein [Salinactinospora qingdaonensis]|uniref:Uncharacterized protein n=1 Tax=Salinactinospora qingdaonensis TaxID=702744 RepID=A0ABP7FJD0_9ACTN